jgi:hypothetical protein
VAKQNRFTYTDLDIPSHADDLRMVRKLVRVGAERCLVLGTNHVTLLRGTEVGPTLHLGVCHHHSKTTVLPDGRIGLAGSEHLSVIDGDQVSTFRSGPGFPWGWRGDALLLHDEKSRVARWIGADGQERARVDVRGARIAGGGVLYTAQTDGAQLTLTRHDGEVTQTVTLPWAVKPETFSDPMAIRSGAAIGPSAAYEDRLVVTHLDLPLVALWTPQGARIVDTPATCDAIVTAHRMFLVLSGPVPMMAALDPDGTLRWSARRERFAGVHPAGAFVVSCGRKGEAAVLLRADTGEEVWSGDLKLAGPQWVRSVVAVEGGAVVTPEHGSGGEKSAWLLTPGEEPLKLPHVGVHGAVSWGDGFATWSSIGGQPIGLRIWTPVAVTAPAKPKRNAKAAGPSFRELDVPMPLEDRYENRYVRAAGDGRTLVFGKRHARWIVDEQPGVPLPVSLSGYEHLLLPDGRLLFDAWWSALLIEPDRVVEIPYVLTEKLPGSLRGFVDGRLLRIGTTEPIAEWLDLSGQEVARLDGRGRGAVLGDAGYAFIVAPGAALNLTRHDGRTAQEASLPWGAASTGCTSAVGPRLAVVHPKLPQLALWTPDGARLVDAPWPVLRLFTSPDVVHAIGPDWQIATFTWDGALRWTDQAPGEVVRRGDLLFGMRHEGGPARMLDAVTGAVRFDGPVPMAATEVLYNSDPIAAVPGGLVIPTNRTRGKVVERAYFVGDGGVVTLAHGGAEGAVPWGAAFATWSSRRDEVAVSLRIWNV